MRRLSLATVVAATLMIALATGARAATFSNPSPITFPNAGAAAPASPYPSVINVAGLPGTVADANVTLKNFSHVCMSDADILLTGPGGRRGLLLSDAGGYCNPPAVGITITLDDEATTTYPCNASPAGTFKPTNDPTTGTDCAPTPDAFPPPAPSGPYPVALTDFDGTSPNGAWSLFVFDESGGSAGVIAGGWSLELQVNATCAGRPTTLTGTAGDDELVGTEGVDVILGFGGNDTIQGLDGRDVICGGDGRDTLRGGLARDRLVGQGGKDKLLGNGAKDKLLGKGGKDKLNGGPGKDVCKGGKKDDTAKKCEVEKSI